MEVSLPANLTTTTSTMLANRTLPDLGRQCLQDFVIKNFFEFLQMFYIVFPSQHQPEGDTDVYNYEVNVSGLEVS